MDEDEKPETLFDDRFILCPFCNDWFRAEDFLALQKPSTEFLHLVSPIIKHSGPTGCKMLFAPIIND